MFGKWTTGKGESLIFAGRVAEQAVKSPLCHTPFHPRSIAKKMQLFASFVYLAPTAGALA